ncbi:MAG: Ig-like domain-containing protein [Eubacteriales bacterium]|nr:Ig-like domain-containing protein [Eubacteriales bacterium]
MEDSLGTGNNSLADGTNSLVGAPAVGLQDAEVPSGMGEGFWDNFWNPYLVSLFSEEEAEPKATTVKFKDHTDPADALLDAFGNYSKPVANDVIEGPVGKNCALASASNWRDNGNLSIVDALNYQDDIDAEGEAGEGGIGNAEWALEDTNVLRYYLHDNKDFDRDTSITDRQRIEVKTPNKNGDVNSYHGEVISNYWKFYLPEDLSTPTNEGSFYHIFQTKATKGDESSMPVFTFSVKEDRLCFYASSSGSVTEEDNEELICEAPLSEILGRWVAAEVTTYTAENGFVYVKLVDLSGLEGPDSEPRLIAEGYGEVDSWRRPEQLVGENDHEEYDAPAVTGQMNRSKWGIYRENDSPRPFMDATMYLADLKLVKWDPATYQFHNAAGDEIFTPSEQPREISWVVAQEPVRVLVGTDYSNIYLPSEVEVYVDAHDKELVDVVWDPEGTGYMQGEQGTYTITGELQLEEDTDLINWGLDGEGAVPKVDIIVTDDISTNRINWALGTDFGGAATVKAVCESGTNPAVNMIDGREDTTWATHSKLVAQNVDGNGGYYYWTAVDLGEVRTFDELVYALGAIGSSKQFRLHSYEIFTTCESEAYDELVPGGSGNPREEGKETTLDPLETAHGDAWEAVPGTYRWNEIGPDGKATRKEISNNIKHIYQLEEAIDARYVLVRAEIETTHATSGAIETKVLKVIGDKEVAEIPEILEVKPVELLMVEPGVDFGSVGLPSEVEVVLADGTEKTALVTWDGSDYQEVAGIYPVTGTLSFADDQMRNPEYLKAQAAVAVVEPEAEPVNWMLQAADIKVVSNNSSGNLPEAFLDGNDDTYWATNGRLLTSGRKYWAAVDLGEMRPVNRIELRWWSTNNALKNYSVYYAEDTEQANAEYKDNIKGGGAHPEYDSVTSDPSQNKEVWKPLQNVFGSGIKNKTTYSHDIETVFCRYLLLCSDINTEITGKAINGAEFAAIYCEPAVQELPSIISVAEQAPTTVTYGTPFGEIDLPKTVTVTLDDDSTAEVPVTWSNADNRRLVMGYNRTSTGTVWIEGTLNCDGVYDTVDETTGTVCKAQMQINIEGHEIPRKVSVSFRLEDGSEYCRYDEVIVGSKLSFPVNDPKKDGYVLSGWYRDAACTDPWVAGTDRLTAEDLVLYAGWKEAPKPEEPKPETPDITEPAWDDSDDDDDDASCGDSEDSGTWVRNSTGWWYAYDQGSYPVNTWKKLSYGNQEDWYFFDQSGYMLTGWLQRPDGNWYYLNPVSDGTQGRMLTGWQFINGKWYYFDPKEGGLQGAMISSGTVDGYSFRDDGSAIR